MPKYWGTLAIIVSVSPQTSRSLHYHLIPGLNGQTLEIIQMSWRVIPTHFGSIHYCNHNINLFNILADSCDFAIHPAAVKVLYLVILISVYFRSLATCSAPYHPATTRTSTPRRTIPP